MVPLIFNPIIYTFYSGYLLGISHFKGLLGVVKQLGYRPKGTTIFPMTTKIRSFTTRPVLRDQHFPPGHRLVQTKQSFIVFRCDVPEQQIKDLAGRFLWVILVKNPADFCGFLVKIPADFGGFILVV